MNKNIIGREYEQMLLDRTMASNESELVILYGRRRVGKTFLINQYFQNKFSFKLTGVYKKKSEVQLERFAAALEEYSGLTTDTPSDWYKAFDMLKYYLKSFISEEKKVVFIDEMPWLDTIDSDFIPAFEAFWNGWASAENNIVLIACGSATSWITDKLLNNKGGLFNRASARIFIRPFTLYETEKYLKSRGFVWTRYDIAECYMIMGGIPFYLKQLDSKLSYTQNIDTIFFREKGLLWDEFDHLYNTLFQQADSHIAIVEALAKKKMGMTRSQLVQETKLPDNGNLSKTLKNLIDSEFIRPYNYYGNKKRDTIYQLSDFYTLFYFSYIKDQYGKNPDFWSRSIDLPSRRAWAGYTFEQLCLYHSEQIRDSIGISGVQCELSSWFKKETESSKASKRKKGAQIDLLIERRDNVINICEMKFSVNAFSIDKEYHNTLRNKIETFRSASKTRKALQVVMVTTFGLKKTMYNSIVQSVVTLDDLFYNRRQRF